ncbi:MAG: hypothetical protein LC122_08760 [Chitinophagales bacterium]|nr:hypothetical protein [Chitinophagales bacterium]
MIEIKFKMRNESNVENFDFFQSEEKQSLISRDLIDDYFSIIEDNYNLEIELSIIRSNDDGGVYLIEVEDDVQYEGEVVWSVKINLKNFDRDYYIDNGDSVTELLELDNFKKLTDCFKDLNSTISKIKLHDHNVLIGFDGISIACIIRNNKNKEISGV